MRALTDCLRAAAVAVMAIGLLAAPGLITNPAALADEQRGEDGSLLGRAKIKRLATASSWTGPSSRYCVATPGSIQG
jgi:hypothetical protein